MTSNQFVVYKLIYFNHLENVLDIQNFHVVLTGDFNIPNFDWEHGLSSITVIIILNRKEARSMLPLVRLGLVSVIGLRLVEFS
jgi:hypothetical protein